MAPSTPAAGLVLSASATHLVLERAGSVEHVGHHGVGFDCCFVLDGPAFSPHESDAHANVLPLGGLDVDVLSDAGLDLGCSLSGGGRGPSSGVDHPVWSGQGLALPGAGLPGGDHPSAGRLFGVDFLDGGEQFLPSASSFAGVVLDDLIPISGEQLLDPSLAIFVAPAATSAPSASASACTPLAVDAVDGQGLIGQPPGFFDWTLLAEVVVGGGV